MVAAAQARANTNSPAQDPQSTESAAAPEAKASTAGDPPLPSSVAAPQATASTNSPARDPPSLKSVAAPRETVKAKPLARGPTGADPLASFVRPAIAAPRTHVPLSVALAQARSYPLPGGPLSPDSIARLKAYAKPKPRPRDPLVAETLGTLAAVAKATPPTRDPLLLGSVAAPKAEAKAKSPPPRPLSEKSIATLKAKTLGNIYYDLNRVGKVRINVREGRKITTDRKRYWHECKKATNFISKMVNLVAGLDDSYHSAEGLALSDEVDDLLQRIGWEGFAIAAYSEAFRRLLSLDQEVDTQLRQGVLEALTANKNSLELYGRVRNIDWRGLLLPYSNDNIRYMGPALKLVKKFWDRHPHELAIPLDGGDHVETPNYDNHRQPNVTKNIWDPADWKDHVDPEDNPDINVTMRWAHVYDLGCCDFCECPHVCRCQVQSMPGELVELVKTADRGIGVRALWPFRKGDILGEYIGRLIPDGSKPDQTYALAWEAPSDPRTRGIVSIDAYYQGNWTRFVNHACKNASVEYRCRTFGDRAAMTLEATRDIAMYEELTVNYGPRYWKTRQCRCGSSNCYSANQAEAQPKKGRARKTGMRVPLQEIKVGEEEQEAVKEKDVAEATPAEQGNAGDDGEYIGGGGGGEEVLCPDPSSNVIIYQDPPKNNGEDGEHPEKDDHKDKNYVPEADSDGDDDDPGPMVVEAAEVMDLSG
ncbi:hypothetical protein ASPACDRAFT_43537 [Aspergillus aculeatus ATCC 16872]|uniref:SET domain-containing protein n=1 Tax=Aspergillus aculeatus (strain ATCC 16872 / CBS 172.66 / WB 5094) TaxID=690307 RepID=A0A1L9WUW8_ASPA1|nr:uncharacterized protein ASPACDRAFT_43537 [Aspergillus aculeatus ATCC 16872]OJJ99902.1 hypothetical protein ASPACDRAFT_43537 [Aspergillus aculeatus ATCC 16872]